MELSKIGAKLLHAILSTQKSTKIAVTKWTKVK